MYLLLDSLGRSLERFEELSELLSSELWATFLNEQEPRDAKDLQAMIDQRVRLELYDAAHSTTKIEVI